MTERTQGRIVRSLSGFYDVQTDTALVTCRARGILRKEGNSPLTGDLVEITVERGKGERPREFIVSRFRKWCQAYCLSYFFSHPL